MKWKCIINTCHNNNAWILMYDIVYYIWFTFIYPGIIVLVFNAFLNTIKVYCLNYWKTFWMVNTPRKSLFNKNWIYFKFYLVIY